MRPNTVEAHPWSFPVGSKMSLYSWFNTRTKKDEGYFVGEELPMTHNGRLIGHVRVTAQHKKMFSNSFYWTAVRID